MVTESQTVKVRLDYSELLAAITDLGRFWETLSELPPSLVNRLVRFVNFPPEIAKIEVATAEGACLTVTLKPSDSFADLLAALRAVDLKGGVVGDNRCHEFSV
jgi:hypothetical protein